MNCTWSEISIDWNLIDFVFSESWCEIVEIVQTGGPTSAYRIEEIVGRENVRKLIHLLCMVNGTEYLETKERKDVIITINDMKSILNHVNNIKVKLL